MAGWLDNYNDSKESAPEGFQGDGYSNVGRNSSPAWGGQFQMGGYVYPVNYVPEAQTGGSFPGATGFSYARTGSIPSKGPRRNQTNKTDASAQNGKEMQYYREGLDWKPKTISKDGVQLDKAQDGDLLDKWKEDHPSIRSFINTAQNRKIQENKGRGKETNIIQKDNAKTVKPKETKKLSGKQQNELAQRQSEEQARKDWVQGSMEEAYKSPLMSPGYFTPEGMAVGALQGATKIGPDLYEGDYKSAAMDALMMLPEVGNVAKALGPTEGLLSNAYKINPWAFKPNESNWYRQVGESAINDAKSLKLIRENSEVISSENWKSFQNQIKDLQGNPEITNHFERMKAQINAGRRPTAPFFQKGSLFYPMNRKPVLTSKNPAAKGSSDFLIETNLPNESFQPAYVKGMTVGIPEEIGTTAILKPNPELRNLENFNIYKKDWLQGYKKVPKKEEGGIIKDDRGQWDHPGEITRISGGNITMKKDPKTGKALTEPLLGIADTGEQQWMYPGEDYNFEGANYVTEYPKGKQPRKAKNGLRQEQKGLVNLDQLTNWTNYNTKQKGGWLDNL